MDNKNTEIPISNPEQNERKLRILMLEDAPDDAALVERRLLEGGVVFSSKLIDTREAFIEELKDFAPDLILSDYSLPQFDGLSALEIAKTKCPDVPFIFVTGAMGEEWAIESLKRGATDYVLKDKLSRLIPAVKRALAEAEERTERKKAEEELKKREKELRNRVQELEEFYDMGIGRELRMIELKKEIEALKKELEKYKQQE